MANASLLDEGTAAGEAMALSFHNSKDKKRSTWLMPIFILKLWML